MVALSSSSLLSIDTMIPHSETMTMDSPLAGPGLMGRSERMLRWKSREAFEFADVNFDRGSAAASADHDADRSKTTQQGQLQAGPIARQSLSPSRNPCARPESPSTRGESVRRWQCMDFDTSESSTGSQASKFESTVSTALPSFTELALLNQPPPPSSSQRKNQSPARSTAAGSGILGMRISSTGAADHDEGVSSSKKPSRRVIKPEEKSRILKARKLLELRSHQYNVKATPSPSEDVAIEARRRPVATAGTGDAPSMPADSAASPANTRLDDSSSYEFIDLTSMAKELTKSRASTNSTMLSPKDGYENVYFSPRSEKLRNHMLQQGAAGVHGTANPLTSSPRILEFSGTLHTGVDSFQGRLREKESPQVKARNAFLERLHGERGGHTRSESVNNLQMPSSGRRSVDSQSATSALVSRGDTLSQSARFARTPGSDFRSPRTPRGSGSKPGASGFSHQSLKKVLDSTARTSGLSLSCRRSSIADDVFETSGESQASAPAYSSAYPSRVEASPSSSCRPSPWRQSTFPDERVSARIRNDQQLQQDKGHGQNRIPRPPAHDKSPALVGSKAKEASRPPSPGKSFKKWVASQFHFGGQGKKIIIKDESVQGSPSASPDSDLRMSAPAGKSPSWWSVKQLPAELLLKNAGRNPSESPAHRLPKPPPDASAENGKGPSPYERSRLSVSSTQSGDLDNNSKEGSRRHEKKSSRHRHDQSNNVNKGPSDPPNPSGPLKFQGLQNLFAADVNAPSPKAPTGQNAQAEADGKPKRTMKFLECAEVADLNEFLRAKREWYNSCLKNGRGYLKFIRTQHPTNIGSMVASICYSYFLEKTKNGPGRWNVVPLVNFPRWQMKDHLDAAWLFNVSGVDVKSLLFSDEVDFEGLSRMGTTTRVMLVGEDVLKKNDEVGSCCTLLAETYLKEAQELWSRSGPILKTLLVAGLLMETDNLSKSSVATSRDHQVLVNLSTGAGPLGRFGLFDRMRTVYTDPEVLKMAKKYYGITEEQCTDPPARPPPAPKAKTCNETKKVSPKGSPLFSSETEDSKSSSSPSSNSDRSRSISPATTSMDKPHGRSLRSKLPTAADAHKPSLQGMIPTRKSGVAY